MADTLMPAARLISYMVMTGPVSISTTWASILNSLQRLLEDRRLLPDEALLAFGISVLGLLPGSPSRAGDTRPVPSAGGGGGAVCRGFRNVGSLTMIAFFSSPALPAGAARSGIGRQMAE